MRLALFIRRYVDGGAATADSDNVYISVSVVVVLEAPAAHAYCEGQHLLRLVVRTLKCK